MAENDNDVFYDMSEPAPDPKGEFIVSILAYDPLSTEGRRHLTLLTDFLDAAGYSVTTTITDNKD